MTGFKWNASDIFDGYVNSSEATDGIAVNYVSSDSNNASTANGYTQFNLPSLTAQNTADMLFIVRDSGGNIVYWYLDANSVGNALTADSFSIPTGTLSDGTYTISAYVMTSALATVDSSGNSTNVPASTSYGNGTGNGTAIGSSSFTVDLIAPTTTPSLALDEDTSNGVDASYATDAYTKNGKINVTPNNGNAWEYRYKLGSGTFSAWTAGSGTSFDLTSQTAGVYTVEAREKDAAGNAGSAATLTFTLDKLAAQPTVVLTTNSGDAAFYSGAATDAFTNTSGVTASGGEAGAKYQYSTDNSTWTDTQPTFGSDGSKTVYVRQVDKAGNESISRSLNFTLDTVGPAGSALSNTTVTANLELAGSVEALTRKVQVIFKDAGGTVVWSAGTNTVGGVNYLSTASGASQQLIASSGAFDLKLDAGIFGDDNGELYTVEIIAEDSAGNQSTQVINNVLVDALAPDPPSVQEFAFVTPDNRWRHDVGALGYLAPVYVTTDPTATVTAWVEDGPDKLIEQTAVWDPALLNGLGAFSMTPTYVPDGDPATVDPTISLASHYGTLRMLMAATDSLGNVIESGGGNPAAVSLIYGANVAAPVPGAPTTLDGTDFVDEENPGTQETSTFDFSSTPLVGGATYKLQVGGVALTATVGKLPVDLTPPTVAQLATGLMADPDYSAAPFTISADGTNLVVTWKEVGNQADLASFSSVIDDVLIGENTFLTGGQNNTTYPLDDLIVGYAGNDYIEGQAGNDYLFGGSDSDTILGGAGNDYIAGGTQKDYLTGGDDNDRFVYSRVNESGSSASSRDVITDFTALTASGGLDANADIIDLSEIRSSLGLTLTFKSSFTFGATGKSGGTKAARGDVWLSSDGILYANTSGNEAAELGIELAAGGYNLTLLRAAFGTAGNGMLVL